MGIQTQLRAKGRAKLRHLVRHRLHQVLLVCAPILRLAAALLNSTKRGKFRARKGEETMATVRDQDPEGIGKETCQSNLHRDITARLYKHSKHAKEYAADITVWNHTAGAPPQNGLLPNP